MAVAEFGLFNSRFKDCGEPTGGLEALIGLTNVQ